MIKTLTTTLLVAAAVTVISGVASAQPTGNEGPIGSTLRVWSSDTSYTDVTVSNERFIPDLQVDRIDVTVHSYGDTNSVGYFTAQNVTGHSGDQVQATLDITTGVVNGLDESGTMNNGEVRTGTVDFPVLGVTQIDLHEGLGPSSATWNVQ